MKTLLWFLRCLNNQVNLPAMKSSVVTCSLFSFQSHLVISQLGILYPLQPHLQAVLQTKHTFQKNLFSIPEFFPTSIHSSVFSSKTQAFTNTPPPHHCFVPLFQLSFSIAKKITLLEYPAAFSDSICPKLKISPPHK